MTVEDKLGILKDNSNSIVQFYKYGKDSKGKNTVEALFLVADVEVDGFLVVDIRQHTLAQILRNQNPSDFMTKFTWVDVINNDLIPQTAQDLQLDENTEDLEDEAYEGGHIQVIIKDITASEVEEIVDGNLGTKCEWLDGSDDTGNRFVIRYTDYSCYISANEELLNAGADVEEL